MNYYLEYDCKHIILVTDQDDRMPLPYEKWIEIALLLGFQPKSAGSRLCEDAKSYILNHFALPRNAQKVWIDTDLEINNYMNAARYITSKPNVANRIEQLIKIERFNKKPEDPMTGRDLYRYAVEADLSEYWIKTLVANDQPSTLKSLSYETHLLFLAFSNSQYYETDWDSDCVCALVPLDDGDRYADRPGFFFQPTNLRDYGIPETDNDGRISRNFGPAVPPRFCVHTPMIDPTLLLNWLSVLGIEIKMVHNEFENNSWEPSNPKAAIRLYDYDPRFELKMMNASLLHLDSILNASPPEWMPHLIQHLIWRE